MNLPDYTVDEKSHLQALVWPRLTARGAQRNQWFARHERP